MARVVVKLGHDRLRSGLLEHLPGGTSVDYPHLLAAVRLWGVKEREDSGFVSSVAYEIALR